MRKHALYDNIMVLAPDGQKLSKMPKKRADWYCRKGLGEMLDEHTLQLKFEPSGRDTSVGWYLVEHQSKCVCCGTEDLNVLEKHHIVPICFRRHLPDRVKNHRSFDLTVLCEAC